MYQSLLVLLFATHLLPADDAKADIDKLQGTWAAVSVETDGNKAPDDVVKAMTLTFKGESMVLASGRRDEKGTFKIDASKKPKSIDFVPPQTENDPPAIGIYEVNGDDLKICLRKGKAGSDRPTEFAAKPGSKLTLLVLKRQKK